MGKTREAEHNEFIQWLLRTIENQSVDALVIAGDIFDTATPPSYARAMYNHFIVKLQKTCCSHLVIVGGNHDSVATLNESKELLACLNTTVVGGLTGKPEDQVILLRDTNGKRGAVICAIPFIRPREVLESKAGAQGTDKQQALQSAIAQHYKNVFHIAQKKAESQLPIIATGHLTTVGGQVSDSEREILYRLSVSLSFQCLSESRLHRAWASASGSDGSRPGPCALFRLSDSIKFQ